MMAAPRISARQLFNSLSLKFTVLLSNSGYKANSLPEISAHVNSGEGIGECHKIGTFLSELTKIARSASCGCTLVSAKPEQTFKPRCGEYGRLKN